MMNVMNVDSRFKLLTLGPWTLFKPEEGTYVFVLGLVQEWTVEIPEGEDNFWVVKADDMTTGITKFLEVFGEE